MLLSDYIGYKNKNIGFPFFTLLAHSVVQSISILVVLRPNNNFLSMYVWVGLRYVV